MVVPAAPGAEQADDPNLEFARQKTDLALEYLKDQLNKGEPDQELLDKLGWTAEDMSRFVARWEEMKRKANERGAGGKEAQKRLDDEPEYAEQYKAYTQGKAKGRKSGK